MVRTLNCTSFPENIDTAYELVDAILAAAQSSLCCCVHRTLGITPGAMVFGRDMLLQIPMLWHQHHQTLIDENNHCLIYVNILRTAA